MAVVVTASERTSVSTVALRMFCGVKYFRLRRRKKKVDCMIRSGVRLLQKLTAFFAPCRPWDEGSSISVAEILWPALRPRQQRSVLCCQRGQHRQSLLLSRLTDHLQRRHRYKTKNSGNNNKTNVFRAVILAESFITKVSSCVQQHRHSHVYWAGKVDGGGEGEEQDENEEVERVQGRKEEKSKSEKERNKERERRRNIKSFGPVSWGYSSLTVKRRCFKATLKVQQKWS